MLRPDPALGSPPTSERFYRMETLGSGGNGVVYRALDLTLGVEVAIKYLTRPAGRDLYRFKREFRALAEVSHPNLVHLYELFVDDDRWSFTMELIVGSSMREHLRRAPETLATTFTQLADGVTAVHALGKIHRDLKPTNVLIEAGGRVVVLDFGLVRGLDPDEIDQTHEAVAVGTPAFMSPEQALDQPLTTATDWYSVGAMLYEALTNKRPFDGSVMDVLRRRVTEDPPRPRSIAPGVSAALDDLCMALMHRDPAQRADGRAIFAAFAAAPSSATLALERQAAPAPFVGRDGELAQMRSALATAEGGGCVFMPVIGPSGMGKSTLLQRFVDELDQAHVMVLEGRCHEREHVPYQGIESLVDAAASLLLARPAAEVGASLPPDLPMLAKLFPALLRVPAIEAQRGRRGSTDPAELRRRAIGALGDLLAYLAGQRTLVVVLDDLQWCDADGGAVLAELVRYFAESGALFVASSRSAVDVPATSGRGLRDATPTLQLGHATEPVGPMVTIREIELGPLRAADVAALAEAVAPSSDWTTSAASALTRASGGVPLFVTELAGYARRPAASGDGDDDDDGDEGVTIVDATTTLERVIAERVAKLPGEARALLAACAAATRPLPLEVAAAAAAGDAATALTILRSERLVRTHRRGNQLLIEPYHDRIRLAVIESTDAGAMRAVHRRLATALEGRTSTAPTDLVEHWLAAGVPERAAVHARTAARQAEDALAFHVAADLYRTALAVNATPDPGDRPALLKRLASCLANVGRLDAAIDVLTEAAAAATGTERRALESQKIEYVIRLGDLERGMNEARALCAAIGYPIPRGRRAVMLAILTATLGMRLRGSRMTLRTLADADPAAVERVDVLMSLVSGMANVDPAFGRLLQVHHLRAAMACGEKTRLARALSVEVPYIAQSGSRAGPRLERALERARVVVEAVDRPEILAVFQVSCAVAAGVCGQWAKAEQLCRSAEQLLRENYSGIRWVLNMTQFYRCLASWYLGRTDELVRLVPMYLADAEALGDSHALGGLRFGRGNPYWLIIDQPEEARAHAVQGWRRKPGGDFHLHDYFQTLAEVQCSLYQGKPEDAFTRLAEVRDAFDRSLVRRIQMVRVEWNYLTARAALGAAATRTGRGRSDAIAIARACGRRIAGERTPWAAPLHALGEAAIAHLGGDGGAEVAALERAIADATTSGMALHAEVARHRLGEARGGSDGRALTEQAAGWMKKRAIVNPGAIVRMLAPGWV